MMSPRSRSPASCALARKTRGSAREPLTATFLAYDLGVVHDHLAARERRPRETGELPALEGRPVGIRLHLVRPHGVRACRVDDRESGVRSYRDGSLTRSKTHNFRRIRAQLRAHLLERELSFEHALRV